MSPVLDGPGVRSQVHPGPATAGQERCYTRSGSDEEAPAQEAAAGQRRLLLQERDVSHSRNVSEMLRLLCDG